VRSVLGAGPVIDAGQRDKLITFLRPTFTTDEYGGQVPGLPSQIAQARAKVLYGTGQERREAAQTRASITATFLCNWTPLLATVVETDQISFGEAWDVRSCALVGHNDEIHFTAIRADQGEAA